MTTTVLIIEDNEQNMYLTRFLLQSRGYHVLEARDGPAGIAMATEHRPDLILLDIQLPRMDGYSVAGALKQHPDTRSIPIVAVTSYAMAGDCERVMAAGCEGYIEKPINPDTFLTDIERFLPQNSEKERPPCLPS
jgi:two-component system, cell cycle response regulator DivK